MKLLTIGALASEVGVSAGTIRLWEKIGLLTAERDSGNRRLYDADDIVTAKGILARRLARRGCGLRNQNVAA
jgi:DNA-binding transcriptional MerR regulator